MAQTWAQVTFDYTSVSHVLLNILTNYLKCNLIKTKSNLKFKFSLYAFPAQLLSVK